MFCKAHGGILAGLFTGNAGQIAVGVILVVLLPVGFLLASAIFIWRYLYHPTSPSRRAAFILLDNPDEPMVHFLGPDTIVHLVTACMSSIYGECSVCRYAILVCLQICSMFWPDGAVLENACSTSGLGATG